MVAPKEFFDLYDLRDMTLPPDFASLPMIPFGFPEGSIMPFNGDMFMDNDPHELKNLIYHPSYQDVVSELQKLALELVAGKTVLSAPR